MTRRRPALHLRLLVLVGALVASALAITGPASASDPLPEPGQTEVGLDATAPARPGQLIIFTENGERPATPQEQAMLRTTDVDADGAARRSATASMTVNGITVNYLKSTPADVVAATQAAAAVWGASLQPRGPVEVNFDWASLPQGVLGAAGPTNYFRYNTQAGRAWLPAAVSNHHEGVDVSGDGVDLEMILSSSLYNTVWCTSTDGSDCTFNKISLYDTILHEFAHGLGLLGTGGLNQQGQLVINTVDPDLYDTHVRVGQGIAAPLLIETPNPVAQLTGQNLYMRTVGGQSYRLHAPINFQPGSSYAHLDEQTYGTQLLTPSAANGEFTGVLDAITLDIMKTVGWDTGIIDGRTVSSVSANECSGNNSTLGSNGGSWAAQVASDVHQASIWRLYSAVFLREPEAGGFAFWNSQLNPAQGGSVDNYPNAATFFVNSPEFDATYGSLSDRLFVDRLYCNVFDRLADAGGRAFWLNELATGRRTRGSIILFWADSQEFRDETGVTLLR